MMMRWRLCCLLLATIAVNKTNAKPLIEDATFSDIDLLAEDTQQNAVYVAAPIRTKRMPQLSRNNCIYSSSSASSSSFSGKNDCNGYKSQEDNYPPPPPAAGYQHHHHSSHYPRPPPPRPYFGHSIGFHNYPPPPPLGSHGYVPLGFHSAPPFGEYPGLNHGPPPQHLPHPSRTPSVFAHTPTPAIVAVPVKPTGQIPEPTQPNQSSTIRIPTVSSTTKTPPFTTEPVFDIDIRIGD
ncbi:uncharacterized protein [Eurosta solidaginis]|uniref:uncharacterized protein n=1 Tax=Eurosta solidaginis TaxID=178769 RepID=UPI003531663A